MEAPPGRHAAPNTGTGGQRVGLTETTAVKDRTNVNICFSRANLKIIFSSDVNSGT